MVNIVLVEPEIPQNCGNIARTCAATRCRLHLVEPLGFDISEKAVKRAGLDYWPMVDLSVYKNLEDLFARNQVDDLWLATTKAPRDYSQAQFWDGCWLFFGKETAGLPLTGYQEFQRELYEDLPIINTLGIRDSEGNWYGENESLPEDLASLLSRYQVLQYNNLFDKDRRADSIFSLR